MTGPFLLAPRLAAVCLLLTVGGCSKDSPPAPNATVAPAYAAVARGRIDIEGGLLSIEAPREGTLQSVHVHEGDEVTRGQVLATMDTRSVQLQTQASEAGLAQAHADAALLTGKLALARQQARRLTAAAKAGAGDEQSADNANGVANDLVAQKAAAEAAIDVAKQKVDSARYEWSLRTLRAPIDARITRVTAQVGSNVSPQSGPLFTLLPKTPPIIRAELSESMVDAVRVGMPATVSADGGGNASNWSAHVVRVGNVVGPSTLEDDPQQRLNARTVSCVLAFDQPQKLRIGQRVLVRFGATEKAPAVITKAKGKHS